MIFRRSESVYLVFVLLLLLQVALNFDGGAYPAVFPELLLRFQQTTGVLGSVNAMTYLGVVAGSLLSAGLFSWVSPRESAPLLMMLVSNILSLLLFVIAIELRLLWLLYVSKFLIGFTQAAPATYTPVWIIRWCSDGKSITWTGLFQAMTVVGIGIGYLCGSLLTGTHIVYAFVIEILLITILTAILGGVCRQHALTLGTRRISIESQPSINLESRLKRGLQRANTLTTFIGSVRVDNHPLQGWRYMLRADFIAHLLSVCCIFFVLTVIQSWSTIVMLQSIQASKTQTTVAFLVIAVTAPILGVIAGGVMGDFINPEENILRMRLRVVLLFLSAVASACAVGAAYSERLVPFTALIWLTLFCGGCTLPSLYKMLISALEEKYRTAASTTVLIATNLLGFALGAWLPGALIAAQGLEDGFRTAMWLSILGTVSLAFTVVKAVVERPTAVSSPNQFSIMSSTSGSVVSQQLLEVAPTGLDTGIPVVSANL
ncbi:MAG: uncharacterized protein KVP18_004580 [Porospora cf. gigantea A]|uniref:uncharacterized protein n=1 Tax=Porospora cf. gigantea A TaxID=2853593 RepID=UPI00355A85CA|nr:MAG: hypothetical protein KVP18_004580 [Porospora cf. gigantea A]